MAHSVPHVFGSSPKDLVGFLGFEGSSEMIKKYKERIRGFKDSRGQGFEGSSKTLIKSLKKTLGSLNPRILVPFAEGGEDYFMGM